MNFQGIYTDGPGNPLTVDARVIMANMNQAVPSGSRGTVMELPAKGGSHYGFPLVDFGPLGKHYVSDIALRVDSDITLSITVDWELATAILAEEMNTDRENETADTLAKVITDALLRNGSLFYRQAHTRWVPDYWSSRKAEAAALIKRHWPASQA